MQPPRRELHGYESLKSVFAPESVAIAGISPRPGSFGERTLRNLKGFRGRVHFVNEKYDEIGGRPCHPSLRDLPEVPDMVAIVAPRDAVEAHVEDCIAVGAKGALVYASGYAETGKADRIALQSRLAARAAETGLRIIGPNCLGFYNFTNGLALAFTLLGDLAPPAPHAVGLVSQSGAVGVAMAQAMNLGYSFSHVLTAGNSCDIDVADLVAFLAEDAACRAIACFLEGMPEPGRLMRAIAIARDAGKPVVAMKIGTSPDGERAALSHTGSLAGSDAAYGAAFERAGALRVHRLEDLLPTAAFLAKAGRPKARGVAVISTSGGAAIMAADEAHARQVALPQPSAATQAVLDATVPDFGSARNPCDVTAQVVNDPGSLSRAAGALLADPVYGALVFPLASANQSADWRVNTIGDLARDNGKVACVAWISGWAGGPGALAAEAHPNVALFPAMGSCIAALSHWTNPPPRFGAGDHAAVGDGAREQAGRLIAQAPASVLTEREAKAVVAAYGVPVVAETLVQSPREAVEAAQAIGFPVALKVESPDIPHKTEAGVVALGLADAEAVEAACARILAAARQAGAGRINGVLVQPMLSGGVELIVGTRRDPQFGPLVVAGSGGVLVELLKDSVVRLAPVGRAEARLMLRQLRAYPLLTGFRGSRPVDLDRLADIISAISQLAADHAEAVEELDVNPVICSGERIAAVDALIRRSEGTGGRHG